MPCALSDAPQCIHPSPAEQEALVEGLSVAPELELSPSASASPTIINTAASGTDRALRGHEACRNA